MQVKRNHFIDNLAQLGEYGLFIIAMTPAVEQSRTTADKTLVLAWWDSRYRQAHGMIGSATVARFASRCWGMYAVGIGMTAACGVVYLALRGLVLLFDAWPGDVMQQHRHREAVVVRGVAHRGENQRGHPLRGEHRTQ